MTRTSADSLRDDYLARLDEAMRGLPHGVAADIRGGIAEELDGLDPAQTAERIGRLGDPGAIAREAYDAWRGEHVGEDAVAPVPRVPATSTRGYAIAAALTLSFGGIVLPIVGWFVGAVLVSLSSLWKTGEKVIAIVVPFALCTLSGILISGLGFASWSSSGSSTGSGTGGGAEVMNPLLPTWYDLIWFGVIALGIILIPLSGLWLLWRLRGRTAR
ncbi:HAAS signaling domain-containing protein [Microbacterium phyllosphaerae]|uniref:HAAS signaling domain-containing protein n=1 Tax=Microbacterium phyllosphaerae TaxID=124798 RepID=UPI0021698A3D|nr:hypothetical protein [Microbacterium phyllosphaerae]MCS3443973.1 putative membrane protein [Microbacterium phyllosphaerae]